MENKERSGFKFSHRKRTYLFTVKTCTTNNSGPPAFEPGNVAQFRAEIGPVATREGFGGLSAPNKAPSPQTDTWSTVYQWSFCQFLECQGPPQKRKAPLLKTFWQRFWWKYLKLFSYILSDIGCFMHMRLARTFLLQSLEIFYLEKALKIHIIFAWDKRISVIKPMVTMVMTKRWQWAIEDFSSLE